MRNTKRASGAAEVQDAAFAERARSPREEHRRGRAGCHLISRPRWGSQEAMESTEQEAQGSAFYHRMEKRLLRSTRYEPRGWPSCNNAIGSLDGIEVYGL